MLGVRSVSGLAFYDWESTELIRRIEITPKNVNMTFYDLLGFFRLDDSHYIYVFFDMSNSIYSLTRITYLKY